jgi:hypothetical protein
MMHEGTTTTTDTSTCARGFARTMHAQASRYQLAEPPTVSWIVQKTSIRNADGKFVTDEG